ncbi:protein trichome birefringence-like 14 [Herrania umbratica]|uniref:Protein trichome birefringence-like 14 n=1 Tax=Herrania umbratica TaxID=108875 RepID=A0A6J0ZIL0_9ROSI|nr:protein trichome birefringence-like 14 [Herrania umbratica]XP_021274030.1 protein trichome birefringence-like 14 [Herrania umbratica]
MKARNNHILGWKQIYIALIVLILMAMLLRHSRKGSSVSTMSSSQDLFAESSLSAEDQLAESSPSREDQFIEPSSSAEDHFTDPSQSAQDALPVAPNNVSVSMNPEGTFEETNSHATMTEETENKELNFDPPPMNSTMSYPSRNDKSDMENTYSPKTQVCNYAQGRWVADSQRPFYSGLGCKRWLPSPWACRLTQRADFSYEGYRWQPINCDLPDYERFAFLRKMQDKTIAFIGDSLGRQQFHSLMCMATGGEESPEVKDVATEYGLVKRSGAMRPDGWAYRFPTTNTTILFYWSSTLCRLERINNTDPDSSFALHLDRVPTFLRKFLHRFNVLVLNTAHHWIKAKFIANRWVMYLNGKPIKNGMLMDMMNVKNFTVHRMVKWLDSQLPLHPGLKAFFRTRSPRHLDNKGNCNNTTPLTGGSEVIQEGSSDKIVETAVKGTKVNILDITALSALRDEAHKSQYRIFGTSAYYDCLHWCLPGIPDTWNELLVAQL